MQHGTALQYIIYSAPAVYIQSHLSQPNGPNPYFWLALIYSIGRDKIVS
jgi:hypothetical protein